MVRDPHPLAFRRGRFVLFDGRSDRARRSRPLLTPEHVAIDVDLLRRDEPVDPFEALVDHQDARGDLEGRRWTLTERVSRHAQGLDPPPPDRRPCASPSPRPAGSGCGWRPSRIPYRSAFNFRVDLDEPVADDYHRFALPRQPLADCCTHFVSTHAYAERRRGPGRPARVTTRSRTGISTSSTATPRPTAATCERADRILRDAGLRADGLRRAARPLESRPRRRARDLGYLYSSDFQLGYDDFPFFPWKGDRFSRVLQVPVHPVCEGLFLDAGVADSRVVADYLAGSSRRRSRRGEPAFVYGHPERRLGRMPEILTPCTGARPAVAGLAGHA